MWTQHQNLEINVFDLLGSTLVYASRTNPHPYKYDNDIAFDLSQQKNKIIVISARLPNPVVKRSTDDGSTRQIYVSVTSDTDSASFTIEGNECDPLNCTEGTNEMPARNRAASTQNHLVSLRCWYEVHAFECWDCYDVFLKSKNEQFF